MGQATIVVAACAAMGLGLVAAQLPAPRTPPGQTAPSQNLDLGQYLPTAAGTILTYDISRETRITTDEETRPARSGGTVVDRFIGENGAGLATLHRTVSQVTSARTTTLASVLHIRHTETQVAVHAIGVGDATPTALEVPQPWLMRDLPGPSVLGAIGDLRLTTQLTSQSACAADVPAGVFTDSLCTESTGTVTGALNGMPVRDGSIRLGMWFARDVGLVREERVMRMTVTAADGKPIDVEERSVKALTKQDRTR